MKNVLSKLARAGIVLGLLAVGGFAFGALVSSKPTPKKAEHADVSQVVRTSEAHPETHTISVRAQGSVVAAEQVQMAAEVMGQVVWQNDAVIAGGRLKKGDTIVRIDSRDYALAANQQKAQIERARMQLELERGRKSVAEREWKLLREGEKDADPAAKARALREPQIRSAQNDLEAARAGYRRARLARSKTVLRAPFNSIVLRESVGKGQLVAPQTPVATLVSTDAFLVYASVPVAQLPELAIPGVNAEAGKGSKARVIQDTGDGFIERDGRVVRLLGDLDAAGQMARVVIEVRDPLALATADVQPLLLGSHVQVTIDAGALEDVFVLPRAVLRGGKDVYVLSEGSLEVREVSIAWRDDDAVYVREGLHDGDQIVTSALAAPVPGMKLRADNSTGDGNKLADTTAGAR